MFQSLQALVPAQWSGAFELLSTPVAWIPAWHIALINLTWYGSTTAEVIFKRALVLLPVLLIIAAVWCTMVSMYTLPFRSGRRVFITSIVLAWWDALRTIWFYWAGMIRVGVVLVGWMWGILRTAFRLVGVGVKGTFQSPLNLLDWTSRNYFKPGVPWVAFLGLILWCAVEALIFSYTLRPTMTEVLAGMTGFEPDPRMMTPILWIFLFFLVLGSFACIQALSTAVQSKQYGAMIQMALVELFVMFFEVLFLYREMIDALTPWIAQQSNESVLLGLWATLALASFGWVGVRGMTWFLFGRYGTPALLSVLARDTIKHAKGPSIAESMPKPSVDFRGPIEALKAESAWFKAEARSVFELMSLPVLQVLAAAANFATVTVLSRPIFQLPFRDLDHVLATTPAFSSSTGSEDAVKIRQEAA